MQLYTLPSFTFSNGTTLAVKLAYKILNPQCTKAALIATCFRGHLETTLTFSTGALRDYKIIVVALLGNGESTSPSNTRGFPETGVSYEDCVRAQHALVTEHLKITQLDLVLRFSMGGQCAYYWTAMYGTPCGERM